MQIFRYAAGVHHGRGSLLLRQAMFVLVGLQLQGPVLGQMLSTASSSLQLARGDDSWNLGRGTIAALLGLGQADAQLPRQPVTPAMARGIPSNDVPPNTCGISVNASTAWESWYLPAGTVQIGIDGGKETLPEPEEKLFNGTSFSAPWNDSVGADNIGVFYNSFGYFYWPSLAHFLVTAHVPDTDARAKGPMLTVVNYTSCGVAKVIV